MSGIILLFLLLHALTEATVVTTSVCRQRNHPGCRNGDRRSSATRATHTYFRKGSETVLIGRGTGCSPGKDDGCRGKGFHISVLISSLARANSSVTTQANDYYRSRIPPTPKHSFTPVGSVKNSSAPVGSVTNSSVTIGRGAVCPEKMQPVCRNNGVIVVESLSAVVSGFGIVLNDNSLGNQTLTCCSNICWNNCSCVAYATFNITRCQIWMSGTSFSEASGLLGDHIFILKSEGNAASRWWRWLLSAAGGLLGALALGYLCNVLVKHKAEVKRKRMQRNLLAEIGCNALPPVVHAKGKSRDVKTTNEMLIFSFETIMAATDNFSPTNKLGQGGYGPVYKGKFINGTEVAIKRLSNSSGQGQVEFKNEVKLIARLQHTYLVRLIGVCVERDERMLVYEYMSNKSLDFYIFDSKRKALLDWKKRLSIIEGIAQGLLYMHSYSRLKVIHRDLKASNILLDEDMNPKISDFGMARIFGLKSSEENTNRVVGTYGYMSPEYAMRGIVSIKTDVFSFGVLTLEIISGRRNNSLNCADSSLNLIGHAWELWNERQALELLDFAIVTQPQNAHEVLRCIQVGLLCVQDQANDRPTMLEVVSFLSNDLIQMVQPKRPAFFIGTNMEEQPPHLGYVKEYQASNYLTISDMDGR